MMGVNMVISTDELKKLDAETEEGKRLSLAFGPTTIALQYIESNKWAIDRVIEWRESGTDA